MFDILAGRIRLPNTVSRAVDGDPYPVGKPVQVELETHDMKRSVVEGLVAWCEHQWARETDKVRVSEMTVLIEREDGVEALGRFVRDRKITVERVYRAKRLQLVRFLSATERDKVVDFLIGKADAKHTEPASASGFATRALQYATGPERERAFYTRAKVRAALGAHELALEDWNAALASYERPHAVLGRARTRIALGDRVGGFADARRAAELGLADAVSLVKVLTPPPSNRVRHKTFGDGTIVKRLDGDKLEIQFAGGTKTLAARFVETIA
jgi:hypothetical protein